MIELFNQLADNVAKLIKEPDEVIDEDLYESYKEDVEWILGCYLDASPEHRGEMEEGKVKILSAKETFSKEFGVDVERYF